MDKNYEFENIVDMQENGKFLGHISYKPNNAVIGVMIIGCACTFIFRNMFGILFGGFLLILSVIVFFCVKDHKVMDVYDDALVLYDHRDETRVLRLPLEEIQEWNVNRNNSYLIALTLKGGEQLGAQTFNVNRVYNLLKKVLPGKSTEEIMQKRVQSQKGAGFSIFGKKRK